ncbi:MAG TPA: 6-phosphofructokinase [Longimicrobium sp.]|nr:6-phosphofructokinase [Longimicrobium sp.]
MQRQPDGTWGTVDRSDEIVQAFRQRAIDTLIAIGGIGSLNIAHALHQKGLPVIGVPKTIENDLSATDVTFGFQTAVEVATDAITIKINAGTTMAVSGLRTHACARSLLPLCGCKCTWENPHPGV